MHAVVRGDEVAQGPAHVAELSHGAAPQHGALQLLSLHLLLFPLDLLLQAPAAVLQLCQLLLQLCYLLLQRFDKAVVPWILGILDDIGFIVFHCTEAVAYLCLPPPAVSLGSDDLCDTTDPPLLHCLHTHCYKL